ncbi:MAG TPA: pyridoxamine 5'-phosphate oxidase family protein [Candidatus Binatia bacterium]|nr:pyridoxamine 5'-phosphate oxidase family protein [Candidatus Binatia bacterium]
MMNMLIGLLIVVGLCLVGMVHEVWALSEAARTQLHTAKEIYVATQRANGEWSTAAPVWFIYDGQAVYLTAAPTSYKARRVKRSSPVRIWVGSKEGPSFTGKAEIIEDLALVERMGTAYQQKYWIAWLGLFRPRASRVAAGKTIAIKVTPLDDSLADAPAE